MNCTYKKYIYATLPFVFFISNSRNTIIFPTNPHFSSLSRCIEAWYQYSVFCAVLDLPGLQLSCKSIIPDQELSLAPNEYSYYDKDCKHYAGTQTENSPLSVLPGVYGANSLKWTDSSVADGVCGQSDTGPAGMLYYLIHSVANAK